MRSKDTLHPGLASSPRAKGSTYCSNLVAKHGVKKNAKLRMMSDELVLRGSKHHETNLWGSYEKLGLQQRQQKGKGFPRASSRSEHDIFSLSTSKIQLGKYSTETEQTIEK